MNYQLFIYFTDKNCLQEYCLRHWEMYKKEQRGTNIRYIEIPDSLPQGLVTLNNIEPSGLEKSCDYWFSLMIKAQG